MTRLLPGPSDPERPDNADSRGDHEQHERTSTSDAGRRKSTPPSIDDIVQQLLQLNGAVAMGLISPAKANVISRNLRTMLDVHFRREVAVDGSIPHESLVDLCARDPQMLNVLAPFLTDDQVSWIMRQREGESDG